MRQEIEEAIETALEALGVSGAYFTLERPGAFEHGDYATNAALVAAKVLKKNPKEIAELLKAKIEEEPLSIVEKIEVAGAGFINFFLSRQAVLNEVKKAAHDEKWGENTLHKGKTVMVEYTDPNPFKEFHIGHLMSNAIGESIARLFESSGAKVSRANYQGDIGLHVAKAIWGKQQKPEASWGESYVYGSEHYEAHKEGIDSLNKVIYEKTDPAVNELYDAGRDESLAHFEDIYRLLGTTFTYYFFESETGPKGLSIVREHSDVFKKSEGAIIFEGEEYGLHTRVFVNSKGLPTYEAKELGLVEAKKEKGDFDISLTVTANEISDYFKVVRKAAELVFPDLEGKMLARFHGFLKLTTGKMSSRKGNVVTGESLLADLQAEAKEKVGERELKNADTVGKQVAVGAIKYAVLKQGSGKDIVFDSEKSLSLEGDSGPYLQYARVRALSLIEKARGAEITDEVLGYEDIKTFVMALTLDRLLVHFPETIEHAAQELEPHYVTTYLIELASLFNSWYASERLIGGRYPSYALLITEAIERTLTKGLTVLGIPVPEEM
jgi:arginyl-tRNA synthetase